MKRIIAAILAIILILPMTLSLSACKNRAAILKIYNCDDYIDEDVLYAFEDYYEEIYGEQITIEYYTYDTNETMYTKIARSKRDYDLAILSDYMAEKMIREGLTQKIDYSNIPNLFESGVYEKNGQTRIDPSLTELFSDMSDYFIPYLWGTIGILYNKEMMLEGDIELLYDDAAAEAWERENGQELNLSSTKGLWSLNPDYNNIVHNWAALWDSDYEYQIYMKDSMRDSIAAASIYAKADELIKYLGTPEHAQKVDEAMNAVTPEWIDTVERALKAQKKYLKGYEVDHGKDEMVNGTVTMLLAWSGDAVWSMMENEDLGYYIPREGSNIWVDGYIIPKYAKNKLAAERFINYLHIRNDQDPFGEESEWGDNGLIIMDTIGYTSPLKDVQDRYYDIFLEEYLLDENGDVAITNTLPIMMALFPSQGVKDRSAKMRDFADKQIDVMKMWSRLGVF